MPFFIGPLRCHKAETPLLQAAIEYLLKNADAAREALTDMPPRSENELDAVTLHNQALMNMELKPTDGFGKLQFLLQQNPFPPETFGNLLLLYCKYESVCCCQIFIFQISNYFRYEYYDLAADVLAENAHLTYKYLTPYLYDFLEALITQQTSPDEAYRKVSCHWWRARHVATILVSDWSTAVRHDRQQARRAAAQVHEAGAGGAQLARRRGRQEVDQRLRGRAGQVL